MHDMYTAVYVKNASPRQKYCRNKTKQNVYTLQPRTATKTRLQIENLHKIVSNQVLQQYIVVVFFGRLFAPTSNSRKLPK